MKNDPWWRKYWRSLGPGREVAEELQFHIDRISQELEEQGMSPAEARTEAVRRFGDRGQVQGQLERIERRRGRQLRFGVWLDESWQDVRYAARALLKRPSFTIAATLSLALGIGVATVMLTIVDSWMFRPLSVPRNERLVLIGSTSNALGDIPIPNVSLATIGDLAQRRDLFDEVSGWRLQLLAERAPGGDRGRVGPVITALGNYFDMLGVRAALGRTFNESDSRARSAVVVLSDHYWRSRLGADPTIIGRPLLLDGKPFTVIGILPRSFEGTEHLIPIDAYFPTGAEPVLDPALAEMETRRDVGFYQVLVRTKSGQSLEAIRAALDVYGRRLITDYPVLPTGYALKAYPERLARPTISAAGKSQLAGIALLGLAALVLGAAAVNVANLILARASGRQEELAVRLALGASRMRLVRQLLTENVMLSLLGLFGGWLGARVLVQAISGMTLRGSSVPLRFSFEVDGRILLMSAIVAITAGLLSGIGPALIASRGRGVHDTLRRSGRSGLGGQGNRFRAGLVIAQVAASFIALISAGLFIRSARNGAKIDIGVNPTGVTVVQLEGAQAGLDAAGSATAFRRIANQVRELPGVTNVAVSTNTPLSSNGGEFLEVFGTEATTQNRSGSMTVMSSAADPEYFDLLGIKLRAGRGLSVEDDSSSRRVALINQKAAETLWPGRDPVGREFRFAADSAPIEVVGVVSNGKYILIGEDIRPYIYRSSRQAAFTSGMILIKSDREPKAIEAAAAEVIARVNPDIVPLGYERLDDTIKYGVNGLLPFRMASVMAGGVGILALILTVVGLYGVLSYSVSQETREIGVRMALGAEPKAIVGRILGRGAKLVGSGVVIGLLAALLLTRALSGLLIGVGSMDVGVYLVVATALVTIAAVAAYLPARRASRLDPVRALRD